MTLAETAELLGNFGEFFGAIAVVVTLGFLTYQLRQNCRQMRMHSQILVGGYAGQIIDVLSDPEKTRLFRKGLNSYASLSQDDQAAFHAIMMGFQMNFYRNAAYLREGIVSTEDYRGSEEDWVRILKCPGAREWWDWVKTMMEPSSVRSVEKLLSDSTQPPLTEVVPFLRPA